MKRRIEKIVFNIIFKLIYLIKTYVNDYLLYYFNTLILSKFFIVSLRNFSPYLLKTWF